MAETPPPAAAKILQVRCPACGEIALYAARNPWRPFCSARCKGVDFGAWASEAYRVAAAPPADPAGPYPPAADEST